jgi:putative component of membrane protein insertase Oxa1/YidC/SpoIIIJ protein YidD
LTIRPGIILALLLFLEIIQPAGAQEIDKVILNADSLSEVGEYENAILEYKRALFFSGSKNQPGIFEKLADCYVFIGDYQEAREHYERACEYYDNDSLKAGAIFHLALLDISQSRYYSASRNLKEIPLDISPELMSRKFLLLGVSSWGVGDYDLAFDYFSRCILPGDRQAAMEMDSLKELTKNKIRVRKNILPVMSGIIPGSGQIIAGNFRDGAISAALCGAIGTFGVASVYLLGQNGFFLFLGPWFLRYYVGGIKHTSDLVERNKIVEKNQILLSIMDIVHGCEFQYPFHEDQTGNMYEYKATRLKSPGKLADSLQRVYHNLISPQDIMDCIYYPSCSRYAFETIRLNGFLGFLDTADRLMRCHLFGQEGYPFYHNTGLYYDPVEEISKMVILKNQAMEAE